MSKRPIAEPWDPFEPTGHYDVHVDAFDVITVRDENGFRVADFGNDADAAGFVRCVHAHDPLRAALQAMYSTAMRIDPEVWRNAWLDSPIQAPLDAASAALDLAIGEAPDEFMVNGGLASALAHQRRLDAEHAADEARAAPILGAMRCPRCGGTDERTCHCEPELEG